MLTWETYVSKSDDGLDATDGRHGGPLEMEK